MIFFLFENIFQLLTRTKKQTASSGEHRGGY